MIERESCYFCTSPFQLLAIISIAKERGESADLYIDSQFSTAQVLGIRVQKTGLFDNVKIIDIKCICKQYLTVGPGLRNHFQIVKTYLHVNEIAKSILLENVNYQNIFLSSKAYLPRMVQLYFIKNNKNINTYYFDDGTGSYENNRAYRIKTADKIIRRLLFGKKSTKTDYNRYLFSPSIYYTLNGKCADNIKEIKKNWEIPSGRVYINEVFGIIQKIDIPEKIIILDQPKDELFIHNDIKIIEDIYNRIIETVGSDNAIVKKHPRSSDADFKNIKCFKEQKIPFELLCMNTNMDDKILITYSSTAVSTPKILFDQEPIVIVLTKLIKPKTGETDLFAAFFNAVKMSYRKPDRFLIPTNMNDFNEIVSTLRRK